MERKLLCALARGCVPDNCCFIDACRQNVISAFVPFKCEDGSLVLAQCGCQSAIRLPNACIAIVTSRGQKRAVALHKIIKFDIW